MNNTPDGFYMTGENDRHFPECEEQSDDKMCICPAIEESQERVNEYNQEVGETIIEGIKL